jgi:hypothetical protein
MTIGLPAAAATAAQSAVPEQGLPEQAGSFWPGDLLSMTNADFENGTGDWNAISNVSTLTTSSAQAFLHDYSLKIVTAGTGTFTSVIQLTGTSGIQIPVNPGNGTASDVYRVGAYVKLPATSGHTTVFDLGCYDSSGNWLGLEAGTPVTNNSNGTWQWVEDDIQLPSDCAYVHGSPEVQFTGMHSNAFIYMDEAWFAPERAALMIGAYAPDTSEDPAWDTDDANIGPLQTIKAYFGGASPALPGQWNSSDNPCYELTLTGNNPPTEPPTCVINLNPPEGTVYSQLDISNFLAAMPTSQTVIMIYHNEAENDSFDNCPGSATGNADNFVCYFEEEAANIQGAAAGLDLTQNVFTAEDSASYQYRAGGDATGCNWIVPSSYVDFYLVDHYERGWANGSNLSEQTGSSAGAQEWNNWLGCVDGSGKPIGLAEYGLCSGSGDCTTGSTCDGYGDTADDTSTMTADDPYLAGEPSGDSPTILWEYFYSGCWLFDNSNGEITEWQSIENQNGGAIENGAPVGG